MRERTLAWEKNINTIRKITGKYPKYIYAVVVCEIQSEWIFLERVTWDTGDTFAGAEKIIWETFLPHIFSGKTRTLSPIVVTLSTMPIYVAGLGLLNQEKL